MRQLAVDLRLEFPGISGFSARNLRDTREFYLTYRNCEKLHLLVAENLIILNKWHDALEREFKGQLPEPEQIVSLLQLLD